MTIKKPILHQNFTKTEKTGVLFFKKFSPKSRGIIFDFGIDFQKSMRRKEMLIFGASFLENNRCGWKEIFCFERFCLKVPKKSKVFFVVEKLFRFLENSMSPSCRGKVWRRNILEVIFVTSAKFVNQSGKIGGERKIKCLGVASVISEIYESKEREKKETKVGTRVPKISSMELRGFPHKIVSFAAFLELK